MMFSDSIRLRSWVVGLVCSMAAGIASAQSNTWIVDKNNGPGTNFTDIPPAIAASAPGDLIVVRDGSYSWSTLSIGVTILGEGTVQLGPAPFIVPVTVGGLPVGQVAVIANVGAEGAKITNCAGTVILESCRLHGSVVAQGSNDVRLHRVASLWFLSSQASRVEVVDSAVSGPSGAFGYDFAGGNGGPGAGLSSGSRVHLSRSSVDGGSGGGSHAAYGGDGAMAISVVAASQLILTGGQSAIVRGGSGGLSANCLDDGNDGDGLVNMASVVRRSGASYFPGFPQGCGAPGKALVYVPGPGSSDLVAVPDDPTLSLVGTPVPGGTVDVELRAAPGSIARLIVGFTPIVLPTAGIEVEQLETRDRSIWLGVVPSSGVISHVFTVPAAYPQGRLVLVQGRVVLPAPNNEVRRTNSVAIVVR